MLLLLSVTATTMLNFRMLQQCNVIMNFIFIHSVILYIHVVHVMLAMEDHKTIINTRYICFEKKDSYYFLTSGSLRI